VPQKRQHTIAAAYELFQLDNRSRRLTAATATTYSDRLEPFFRWAATHGVTLLTDVTPSVLRTYLVHYRIVT